MPKLPGPRIRDLIEAEAQVQDAARHIEMVCLSLEDGEPLKAELQQRLDVLREPDRFELVQLAHAHHG